MFTGMTGDHARSALRGTRFEDLRWVAETGSTNADLLVAAGAGEPDGVVLVADHQTAGRGRLGRTWTAPPGASLLFSVLLRPALDPGELHLLTSALGLAAVDALGAVGVGAGSVGLKWPNDLVAGTPAGERKLAGILAESAVEAGAVTAVVIGMGLNVAWAGRAPADLAAIAVALDDLGVAADREALLVAVLRAFEVRLAAAAGSDPSGRAGLLADHRARCVTLGRDVRVELPSGAVAGRAIDVDDAGRLVVLPGDGGEPVAVAAGDVVHVR
jgi:BirA family biotin operon repressor/biotin-[acetyl-CoA-carboxylase] ligase